MGAASFSETTPPTYHILRNLLCDFSPHGCPETPHPSCQDTMSCTSFVDFLRNAQREVGLTHGDESWALAFWNVFGEGPATAVAETSEGNYGSASVAAALAVVPELKYVKHHIFPQAKEFVEFFKGKVDIDKWAVRLDEALHHDLHGYKGGVWNQRWREFMQKNPNASAREIYEFAANLIDEFELPTKFQHY